MGIHNICLYKEAGKKCTDCNLKTMELLDCVLIGVCAGIRLIPVMAIGVKTRLQEHICQNTYPFTLHSNTWHKQSHIFIRMFSGFSMAHSFAIELCWLKKAAYGYLASGLGENRKNSRSGPKLRILDRFQTPQNANKSVQQVCALNPIFPKPTTFHKSMMSKKSQTFKSFQTDNVRAPFKCDIMVVKRL